MINSLSYKFLRFRQIFSNHVNMSLLVFFQKQNLIFNILLGGLILRWVLFCGDGLGDDPNYFHSFKNIYDGYILNDPYYHRFSYWVPHVLIWKIFWINEFTFILPILLSSIGCIYLVYLIVKDMLDLETGLIAATLIAVNPFEVLNATLISTDVNLSLYILLSVYFFIIAQKEYNKLYFPLSSLFAFFSFVNKPFGLYVLPILTIFFFRKEGFKFNNILKYWFFIAVISGLFLSLFIACWILIGDPLTYITIYYTKAPFHHSKIDLYQLKIYPKQMFFKNEFGERLHGFHFYSVLVCFLFIRRKDWQKIAAILAWFLMIFFLVEFLPHRIENFTPHTAPRIFRYFVIVIPPSILFVSYFWNKLRIEHKNAFALLFGMYVILSVFWSCDSTRIARIAFGEVRSAIKYLKNLGDVDIYSDWYLISKIQRLEYAGNYNPKLHFWTNAETPEAWERKFLSVRKGYVVTGGPRLPYYGCYRCIPNMDKFTPPANWQLIKEFNKDLYPPWKTEPLRIWYVNRVLPYPRHFQQ